MSKIKKVLNGDLNWDLLFVGEGIGKSFIKSKLGIKNNIINSGIYDVNHPATNCAESYFIKKESAQIIYQNILPFNLISDWELAYQIYQLNLCAKWLVPPIFYQGSKSGKYKSELR